jgi:hypothetical protein
MGERNPLELVETPAMLDAETETMDAGTIAGLIATYRELEHDPPSQRHRDGVVRGGTPGDRCGALYGPQTRRTARVAVADVDLLERRLSVRQQ